MFFEWFQDWLDHRRRKQQLLHLRDSVGLAQDGQPAQPRSDEAPEFASENEPPLEEEGDNLSADAGR